MKQTTETFKDENIVMVAMVFNATFNNISVIW